MPEKLIKNSLKLGMVPVAPINPTNTKYSGDAVNAQQWVQSWLDKNENDNQKLRKFYRMITGSYNSNVTINISHYLHDAIAYKKFNIHTCFNRIDLPKSPQSCRGLLTDNEQRDITENEWTEALFHQLIDNLMKQAYDFEIE